MVVVVDDVVVVSGEVVVVPAAVVVVEPWAAVVVVTRLVEGAVVVLSPSGVWNPEESPQAARSRASMTAAATASWRVLVTGCVASLGAFVDVRGGPPAARAHGLIT